MKQIKYSLDKKCICAINFSTCRVFYCILNDCLGLKKYQLKLLLLIFWNIFEIKLHCELDGERQLHSQTSKYILSRVPSIVPYTIIRERSFCCGNKELSFSLRQFPGNFVASTKCVIAVVSFIFFNLPAIRV